MASVGYVHEGDLGIAGREAFTAPVALPEHHLCVVVHNSAPYRDHVDLRDYLRAHPEEVLRYARDKRRLAHLLPTDREAYVDRKAWLVLEMVAAARTE